MPSQRFGTSSSGSSRLGTGGGSTRFGAGGGETKKKKKGGFDLSFLSPPLWLLERSGLGGDIGGGIARAGQAINALPLSLAYMAADPKKSSKQAAAALLGIVEAPYGVYKLHHQGKSWSEIGDMFKSSITDDYKRRYGADWQVAAREDPFSNFMDFLSVLGGGARGAALAGSVGRLGEAGKPLTLANIWRESSAPGRIVAGEPFSRELRYHPPTGREQVAYQPYSRSPLRRFTQEATDALAERFGEAPVFGARARIGRAQSNQLRRAIDRMLGSVPGMDALNGLSEAERTRLFWGSQIGDHSAEGLRKLRSALNDEYSTQGAIPEIDPDFAQWLRDAKKEGFGGKLVERLDAAIKHAEKDPDGSKQYGRARDALVHATNLSEQVIRDAEGFTSLRNDMRRVEERWAGLRPGDEKERLAAQLRDMDAELKGKEDALNQMFASRRGRLSDWLMSKAADSKERQAWEKRLTEQLGPEQAQEGLLLADRLANATRPHDPASFWRERVGMPGEETAQEFVARTEGEIAAQPPLFQPGVRQVMEGGEGAGYFYSPLQRWAENSMPRRMSAQQLQATLSKAIPPKEYYNAGLDLYFDGVAPDVMISREGFLHFLDNPMNAYNIEEKVLRLGDPNFPTKWHSYQSGALLSRHPEIGEYRELIVRLPGEGRDATYGGEGFDHWGQENVVGHVRYHVFEEDGKIKLLIEELQSDWDSNHRDMRKRGGEYHTPTDDEIRQLDALRQRAETLDQEIRQVHDHIDELRRDYNEARGDGQEDVARALHQEINTQENRGYDLQDSYYSLTDEMYRLGQRGVPPAPLGDKYYRALLRRIMREAADENVDEIIFSDPGTQVVRNSHEHYLLNRDEGTPTMDMRADLHDMPEGTYHRLYGKTFPEFLAKEYGLTGDYSRAAYAGHYSTQRGDFSMRGDMPGQVFKVTDAAKSQALKPQVLYQRQPDWDALPKGANELREGNNIIHLFEQGDISTWIHELAHSAVHDLGADERAVIESAFGGGKPITEWATSSHENFARAFERYFREGIAPDPALQSSFKKIADWIKVIWAKAKEENIPQLTPEVRQVFDGLFAHHTPDVFIPHRTGAPNLSGARTSRGIPRAGREIGDSTASRVPLFRRNNLALLRSGLLNDDPRSLVEHVNRVVMLARANQLREAVLEMGHPLLPDQVPNFETQYVVKKAGRGVDKPLYDALESSDDPQEIANGIKDFMDNHITDDSQKWEAWKGESQLYVVDKKMVDILFKNATGKTPGATTKPVTTAGKITDATLDSIRALLLYANPGFYVANMVGNALMTTLMDPRAFQDIAWSFKQAGMAASREDAASPLWHRIAVEMGRGPTSGGLSSSPKILGRRDLGIRHALEDRPPGTTGALAEGMSHAYGNFGRRSGRIIDDSWRVMAWKAAARKRGYKTDEQIEELFKAASGDTKNLRKADTKAKRDLNAIRDEGEQLMLDFDSMTPFERTYLTRVIFLYPFLKASAKYPLMLAGERPISTGLLGQASLQGEQFATEEGVLGPRSEALPAWMEGAARGPGGYWNIGSVAPQATAIDLAQSLFGVGGIPETGINRPLDYMNPLMLMLADMAQGRNKFGTEQTAPEILRQEFPAPSYMRYLWKKPSNIYADRDWFHTLLRSLRYPYQINESEAQAQANR